MEKMVGDTETAHIEMILWVFHNSIFSFAAKCSTCHNIFWRNKMNERNITNKNSDLES